MNDILLSQVYDYVARSEIPFLIAGDFNQRIQTLTAWQAFLHRECCEGFDFASSVLGKTLPPTCRNATRFDSFIFHPFVGSLISDMWVGPAHVFADHSPIYAKFTISQGVSATPALFVPQDWSTFDLDRATLRQQYIHQSSKSFLSSHIHSPADAEHKLRLWSETVEKSVCHTLQVMHQKDPLRCPQKRLPVHFFGRCQPPRFVRPTPKRSARHDPAGGFNPSGEPTSLKTCLKIRQTRRLASLFRQVTKQLAIYSSWQNIPPDTRQNLSREWECIRRAQGFGRAWEYWILHFDCVPLLPQGVPDLPMLHLFLPFTKHETDLSVRQEEKIRRAARKHLIQQDTKDKNGSLVFRALRETEQKVISGLPCPTQAEAKLIRLSKGSVRLLLTTDTHFAPGPASFGPIRVVIKTQDARLVCIETPTESLPVRAQLTQDQYTQDIDKLSHHFFQFWNPMWCRDTPAEADNLDHWRDVIGEITQHIPRQPPVPLRWDDPDLIAQSIDRLKPYKAPGVDGWRAQELKLLPPEAIIADLAQIFHSIWPFSFTSNQMLARVILLAKTSSPQTFSDGRPNTILGYLPRLASKLIADQLLDAWSQSWDPGIAGGLPFRAVKDITIQQQFLMEKAHATNRPIGGFTLDLVKAFNLIPRQVVRHLLTHFGASDQAISFWIRSLNKMKRMLQIHSKFSPAVASTTGAPEGDALSVCAMLTIAAAFFHRMSHIQVRPFTYADNWTFLSTSQRALFRALVSTLNFTSALRMKVDINKSWGWGTSKEMRQFWQCTELLFPHDQRTISVKHASKDLGCMLQYSKQIILGCIKDRMQAASRRLARLGKLHIPLRDKASKIQTAIWPLAFYGAESQCIGDTHFTLLRRQASDALVGPHKYASSFLALHMLCPQVEDPLLCHCYCSL